MINRILFIEPKSPDLHIFSTFALPRLGTILLATIAKEHGYECRVLIENIEELNSELLWEFDLVAISTITSTAPRAYAIADYCRKIGIPVVLGGSHVTFCKDEALEHADFVIRGEGEKAFLKLVDALNYDYSLNDVPNLSFKNGSEIIHNSTEEHIFNLDELPHPDFTLIQGGMKNLNNTRIIPVQTSRGCPFDCTFCSVTTMFGHKYRFNSVEYVLEEIFEYNDDPNNFIFFYDDHFLANRKRTKQLLEEMIRRKFRLKWSAQVRADISKDEELIRLMKQAGCQTVFIGFESTNPDSLLSMKKKQDVNDSIQAIHILKKYKIAIHGMFVFGFDEDTAKSCNATIKFAKRHKLSSVQFLLLTPFPGTSLYEKLINENRILLNDWSFYDAHHVVFQPRNFSILELQLAQMKGHKKFYSQIQLMRRIFLLRIEEAVINIYARRLNRFWKKLNKPYLKLANLVRNSKCFEIKFNIKKPVNILE